MLTLLWHILTVPLTVAEERGVYAFGQASDMLQFGLQLLGSIIDDWDPYYIERVQAALDGTWKSIDTWDGLAPGWLRLEASVTWYHSK